MPSALLNVPMTGGVDQHVDPRSIQPGKLISALNAAIPKSGKYGKRYGTTSVPNTTVSQGSASAMAAPVSLAQRSTEKLAIERGRLLSFDPNKNEWFVQDQVPEWTIRERGIAQGSGANIDGDIAVDNANRLTCYVWAANQYGGTITGNMDCYAQIVDQTTGVTVLGPQRLNTSGGLGLFASAPHVVLVGSTFVAMWNDAQGHIRARTCNVSGAAPYSWTASANLFADMVVTDGLDVGSHVYDVCVVGANFVVVYWNTAGSPNLLTARAFSATLAAGATNVAFAATGGVSILALGISLGTSGIWLTYSAPVGANTVTYAMLLNSATLAVLAAAAAIYTEVAYLEAVTQATIAEYGGTNAIAAWFGSTLNQTRTMAMNFTGAAISIAGITARTLPRVAVMSKAIASLGSVWALFGNSTAFAYNNGDVFRGTAFWMDLNAVDQTTANLMPRPAAVWAPRTAPDGGWRGFATLPAVVADQSGKLRTLASRAPGIVTAASGYKARINMFDLELSSDQSARQSVEAGGLTYLSGGVPSWYDGVRVCEASYLQYPYVTITSSNAGGAMVSSDVYQYAVIFISYDNQGGVHRSAPVIVAHAMLAGENRCVLTISMLNVTTRQDAYNSLEKVAVEIYRTKAAAASGDGSTFRRRTAERADAGGVAESSIGTMLVDPTVSTFTFTDQAADATLDSQPLLYTMGGVLENVNPPSARLVCQYRGRVVYAGCPNGKEIWLSKQLVNGEAPGFTEGLILYIDDGGEITAICSMDDKFFAFKSDRIFFFTGNGPDDKGNGNDWSDPIRIASTVGSVSPFVLVTPMGIVFRSSIGLSLLTRSLEVQPFWGSAVEDDLALFPNTLGMLLHPTLPEIRILIGANAPIPSGPNAGLNTKELRYDYRAGAWLPAAYLWDFDITAGFAAVQSCAVLGGVPYYADVPAGGAAPTVFHEDQTTWLDGAQFVATQIEFAPAGAAGVQGYQGLHSVMFLGDRYTDHDITVDFAFDDTGYSGTDQLVIPAATSAPWAFYQFERSPRSSNKCERVRARYADSFVLGTKGNGRGFELSSIVFDVEPKQGANRRLPATQRF